MIIIDSIHVEHVGTHSVKYWETLYLLYRNRERCQLHNAYLKTVLFLVKNMKKTSDKSNCERCYDDSDIYIEYQDVISGTKKMRHYKTGDLLKEVQLP